MKPFHHYYLEATKEPPAKEDFNTVFAYDEGYCIFKGSKSEYDKDYQMLKALYPKAVTQYSCDELGYELSVAVHEQDIETAFEKFKEDLFNENAVVESLPLSLKNYLYEKAVEMAPTDVFQPEAIYKTFMHLIDVSCVARCTK